MKCYLLSLVIAGLFAGVIGVVREDDQSPEQSARTAAEAWMVKLDSGKYGECWEELAEVTKGRIDKKAWEAYLTSVRKPFGEPISRKLKRADGVVSYPELPGQRWGMLLEYESSFKNKESVIETFEVAPDNNQKWLVAKYKTKDAPAK